MPCHIIPKLVAPERPALAGTSAELVHAHKHMSQQADVVILQRVHFRKEDERLLRDLLTKVKKQAAVVSASGWQNPAGNMSTTVQQGLPVVSQIAVRMLELPCGLVSRTISQQQTTVMHWMQKQFGLS